MIRQLALQVGLPDLASFNNFYPGPNQEAVSAVREQAAGRPGILFLHGVAGTGKSHLLYAAVKEAARRERPAQYVSCAQVATGSGDWLDLSGDGLICIDDIGQEFGGDEGRALFVLYERARSRSGSLLIGSVFPPSRIGWEPPDLESRMQSDLVYRLDTFNERELENALRMRAGQRGIHLSDDVMRFVLNRYERSPGTLFRLLDRVDTESLERKRKITVPFLKALDSEGRERSGQA